MVYLRSLVSSTSTLLTWILMVVASSSVAAPPDAMSHRPDVIDRLPDPLAERIVVSLSAHEVLRAMELGALTSERYVEILLRRIASNSQLNAVIHVRPEQVIAAARAADEVRASELATGALHGLPFLVKDSINTDDLRTTIGTPALADFQPESNAAVVRTLLDAGAILLGKTNLHELQAGYTTNNAFTGATLNPYDFTRAPGGSSGGNGAALAARLAPIALGADTAGSVRVPAALNGVAGFRPTSGRYSQAGIAPLSKTLDTIGPMARNVGDLALADSVITGAPIGLDDVDLDGLRLGLPRAWFHDLIDRDVKRALNRLFRKLRTAGADLVEVDLPQAGRATQQAALAISLFEAPRGLGEYLSVNDTGVSLTQLAGMVASPDVAFLLSTAIAGPIPESDYLNIINGLRPSLVASYVNYIDSNNLDAVILPTNALPASALDATSVVIDEVEMSVFDAYFRLGHYTPLIGAPTLTLPIGQLPSGVPVGGIDIAGVPGDDRRILAIGAAIEKALPRIHPPGSIRPVPIGNWHKSR